MSLPRLPRRSGAVVVGVLGLALLLYPVINRENTYHQTVLFQIFLLAVMAGGWNIISGYTGYVSLGQSAFLGIGAYTVALVNQAVHVSPLILAPLGGVAAALTAVLLGAVIMRTRGHAFVIITIAFLFLMQSLGLNLRGFTGGSNGITLPLPSWSGDIQQFPFYYTMFALMALSILLSWWIRRTKFGTGLVAIREDEDKAAAIGVRTSVYKVLSFAASAVLIGTAGGIYAYFLTFIDPRGMFDILVSVQIVLACLLGGRGTLWGPVVGAFIVWPLNEVTNFSTQGTHLLVFGLLLMAVVLFLPQGIVVAARSLAARLWGESARARPAAVIAEPRPEAASDVAAAGTPRGPLLELEGLTKRFGGLVAVDDCTFAVGEGSVTGLIGPNGSGKTTIFNLVSGMTRADGGLVCLGGKRIDGLVSWDRAYLGLGRTFQITRLFRQMTVLENVVAPLDRFSWRELRADAVTGREARRAHELLEFVGMDAFAGQPAGHLSFGQQKLVELAQILMLEPRLILLDEPAGGINPALIDRIAELIRELNRRGITFLIVEHNMPMVLGLCDPVLVLAGGRCIAQGTPREIQNDSAVLDAYLGRGWDEVEESLEV
jgi:ABC-type branched-subunit amino acid transport system ATPase component/ABC-type branched-subunit amino acid transport system permease subunit